MESGSQRGFTLFELVVCVGLVMVLVTGTYVHYQRLAVDAERAAFRGVLGWLQAGINMELSGALSRGSLAEVAKLEETNPMDLVAKVMVPPGNYRGAYAGLAAADIGPGRWYYDTDRRRLVYRIRYPGNRAGLAAGADRVAFALKVRHRPADRRSGGAVAGLQLVPVTPGYSQTPLGFGGSRG